MHSPNDQAVTALLSSVLLSLHAVDSEADQARTRLQKWGHCIWPAGPQAVSASRRCAYQASFLCL